MILKPGIPPHTHWQHLVPALRQLGDLPDEPCAVDDWYLAMDARCPDDGVCVLLHERPETAIGRAIAVGEAPDASLEQWVRHTEALLWFHKRHRRKSVVMSVEAFEVSPEAALRVAAQSLGLPLTEVVMPPLMEAAAVEPLHVLLASHLVRQRQGLDILLQRLEATSLPIPDTKYRAPGVNIDNLCQRLREERQTALAEREAARASIQMLESELKQSVHAKDQTEQQLQRSRKEADLAVANLRQRLEQCSTALDKANADHEAVRQENQLLVDQFLQCQEALEKALLGQEDLQEQLRQSKEHQAALAADHKKARADAEQSLARQVADTQAARAELATLRQTLDKARADADNALSTLRGDLEQRTTALARVTTDAQDAREENRLLLDQLHLVQDELEKALLGKKGLQDRLHHEEKQRVASQEALKIANEQIAKLHHQLENLRNSASWKATAPIRALSRPFHKASPEKKSLKQQAALIRKSGLFDREWYLSTYPDVAENGMDPLEHYLRFGGFEARNPSSEFDSQWYLRLYPDVAEAGVNPLVHYVKFGKEEGRLPRAV